jgi:hypothetical protein
MLQSLSYDGEATRPSTVVPRKNHLLPHIRFGTNLAPFPFDLCSRRTLSAKHYPDRNAGCAKDKKPVDIDARTDMERQFKQANQQTGLEDRHPTYKHIGKRESNTRRHRARPELPLLPDETTRYFNHLSIPRQQVFCSTTTILLARQEKIAGHISPNS